MNLRSAIGIVKKNLTEYSPEICIGIGISGMILTPILACKATLKVEKLLKEKEELTKKDILKIAVPQYLPSAALLVTSICSIVASNRTLRNRNIAIGAAYAISERLVNEYDIFKKKVSEDSGYEKVNNIIESIRQEEIESENIADIFKNLDDNTSPCRESITGKWFRSNSGRIENALSKINYRLVTKGEPVAFNEYLYENGLSPCEIGNEIGWPSGKPIDISIVPMKSKEGVAFLDIQFTHESKPNFNYDDIF